jgi:hypothetical protein
MVPLENQGPFSLILIVLHQLKNRPGWDGGGLWAGVGAMSRQMCRQGGIGIVSPTDCKVLFFNRASDIVMLKSQRLMGGNRLICQVNY